jgi:hypothetical protein
VQLDHVLLAVSNLAEAANELQTRHGLASLEGGRHPGWGTANAIVPLGDAYLELVTVVDAADAERSVFGAWVAGALPALVHPLGWAVRTGRLDDVADRLGLDIASGSRMTPDGRLLEWRLAGVEQAIAEPCRPFFIEWAEGAPFPGHAPVTHTAGPVAIATLELAGDAERLDTWLGRHDLPITVRPGPPAVTSLTLGGAAGRLTLTAA